MNENWALLTVDDAVELLAVDDCIPNVNGADSLVVAGGAVMPKLNGFGSVAGPAVDVGVAFDNPKRKGVEVVGLSEAKIDGGKSYQKTQGGGFKFSYR